MPNEEVVWKRGEGKRTRGRANAWQRQRRNWNEIKMEKLFVEFANAKQKREKEREEPGEGKLVEREREWEGKENWRALLAYKHILFYLIWFYIWFHLMLYFTLANNRFVSQSVVSLHDYSSFLPPNSSPIHPSIHRYVFLSLCPSVCLPPRLSVSLFDFQLECWAKYEQLLQYCA